MTESAVEFWRVFGPAFFLPIPARPSPCFSTAVLALSALRVSDAARFLGRKVGVVVAGVGGIEELFLPLKR